MWSIRPVAVLTLGAAGLAAALTLAPAAAAASAPPAPSPGRGGTPYPRPAVCVDQAAALGSPTCARITQVLRADEAATADEIAVAVVRSTGGVPIETWGTGLFNSWGVGKRAKNNGVLLVVAVADRRLRIVTGSGLAERLPDGAASEIIGSTITPLLRAGRTRDAVLAGLDAIRRGLGHPVTTQNALAAAGTDLPAAEAAGRPDTPPDYSPPPASDSGSGSGAIVLLVLLAGGLGAVTLYSWYMKGAHGDEYADLPNSARPWWARESRSDSSGSSWSNSHHSSGSYHSGGSSGSSGGGSSNFGGGSSSGGGASGSW